MEAVPRMPQLPPPGRDPSGGQYGSARMPHIRSARAAAPTSLASSGPQSARLPREGMATRSSGSRAQVVGDIEEEASLRATYKKQAASFFEDMKLQFMKDMSKFREQMQESMSTFVVTPQPADLALAADVEPSLQPSRPSAPPRTDRSGAGANATVAALNERLARQQKELRALAEHVRLEFGQAKRATLTPLWKERILQEIAQGELRAVCADEVGKGFRELTAAFQEREVKAALLRLEAGGTAPWEAALHSETRSIREEFRCELSKQTQRFTEQLRQAETEQRVALRDSIGGVNTRVGVVESRVSALTGRCGDLAKSLNSQCGDLNDRLLEQVRRVDALAKASEESIKDISAKSASALEKRCASLEQAMRTMVGEAQAVAEEAVAEARVAIDESRNAREELNLLRLEVGTPLEAGTPELEADVATPIPLEEAEDEEANDIFDGGAVGMQQQEYPPQIQVPAQQEDAAEEVSLVAAVPEVARESRTGRGLLLGSPATRIDPPSRLASKSLDPPPSRLASKPIEPPSRLGSKVPSPSEQSRMESKILASLSPAMASSSQKVPSPSADHRRIDSKLSVASGMAPRSQAQQHGTHGASSQHQSGLRESVRHVQEDLAKLQREFHRVTGELVAQMQQDREDVEQHGQETEVAHREHSSRLLALEDHLSQARASLASNASSLDMQRKQLDQLQDSVLQMGEDAGRRHAEMSENMRSLQEDFRDLKRCQAEERADMEALEVRVQGLLGASGDTLNSKGKAAQQAESPEMDFWQFAHARWMDLVELESTSGASISRASPDSEDNMNWQDMFDLDPSLAESAATFSRGTPFSSEMVASLGDGRRPDTASEEPRSAQQDGKAQDAEALAGEAQEEAANANVASVAAEPHGFPDHTQLEDKHDTSSWVQGHDDAVPGSHRPQTLASAVDVVTSVIEVPMHFVEGMLAKQQQQQQSPTAAALATAPHPQLSRERTPNRAGHALGHLHRQALASRDCADEDRVGSLADLPGSLRATLVASPVEADSLFSMSLRAASQTGDGASPMNRSDVLEADLELVPAPVLDGSVVMASPSPDEAELLEAFVAASAVPNSESVSKQDDAKNLMAKRSSESEASAAALRSEVFSLAAQPWRGSSVVHARRTGASEADSLRQVGAELGRKRCNCEFAESLLIDLSGKVAQLGGQADEVSELNRRVQQLVDGMSSLRASVEKGPVDLREQIDDQKGQLSKLDACLQKLMDMILQADSSSESGSSVTAASLQSTWQSCAAAILGFHMRCEDISDAASSLAVSRLSPESDESGMIPQIYGLVPEKTPPTVAVLEQALTLGRTADLAEFEPELGSAVAASLADFSLVPKAAAERLESSMAARGHACPQENGEDQRHWRSAAVDSEKLELLEAANKAASGAALSADDDESTQAGLGAMSEWVDFDGLSASMASLTRGTPMTIDDDSASSAPGDARAIPP